MITRDRSENWILDSGKVGRVENLIKVTFGKVEQSSQRNTGLHVRRSSDELRSHRTKGPIGGQASRGSIAIGY